MTPIEKAEAALNSRIAAIQAKLREDGSETARQFLLQSLVVCIGIGEALTDYVRTIGQYAQERHRSLRQTHDSLTAQHAEVLKSGNELLEQLKANPGDRVILKEIEAAQKQMATIQKTLKRGANALQRDLAPSMAMIDRLALEIRRLCEADDIHGLKRVIKLLIEDARSLCHDQPTLPTRDIIDVAAWQASALSEIDQAIDSNEAFARTGHQAMLALAIMTMAVSSTPPRTAEEAAHRANEAVAARIKAVTVRFAAG